MTHSIQKLMSSQLQILRPIAVVSDAVNIHLMNFEKNHQEDFSYELVKEGFRIQRFGLIFERRPYHGWDYYGDKQGLGSIRLRPLGTSLTELVLEDSASLDAGPKLFLHCFDFIKLWEDEEVEEPSSPRMTLEEAEKASAARFDRFKAVHEEVRQCIIEGLKQDGILLGQQQISPARRELSYVSKSRIAELRQIHSSDFDLRRLIRRCDELNKCFASSSFSATAYLVRAILDHVPPIFRVRTFAEVANNIGSKSTKASLLHLERSSRNIADSLLHQQIRQREVVPTATQVDFKNDLDVLLGEIVRRLG
jgi:hypothetical protein